MSLGVVTQHKARPLRLPFIYELTLPQPGHAWMAPQQRHGFFGSHIIPSPFLCWSFHQLSPCSCGPTPSIQNPIFNYRNSPISALSIPVALWKATKGYPVESFSEEGVSSCHPPGNLKARCSGSNHSARGVRRFPQVAYMQPDPAREEEE